MKEQLQQSKALQRSHSWVRGVHCAPEETRSVPRSPASLACYPMHSPNTIFTGGPQPSGFQRPAYHCTPPPTTLPSRGLCSRTLIFSLERGLVIGLQAMQENKALISR